MLRINKVPGITGKVGIPGCIVDPKTNTVAVLVSCTRSGDDMLLEFEPRKRVPINEGPIEVIGIPKYLIVYTNPEKWELVEDNVSDNAPVEKRKRLVLKYRLEGGESSFLGLIPGGSKE